MILSWRADLEILQPDHSRGRSRICRRPRGVPSQPVFTGFEKLFRLSIIKALRQALAPAQFGDRMLTAEPGHCVPQDQIALIIGMVPKSLRKCCRDDLDGGMAEANVKIAQSLFNMATTGGSVAAAIFWLKARAG